MAFVQPPCVAGVSDLRVGFLLKRTLAAFSDLPLTTWYDGEYITTIQSM
ncbi:hypothetical protein EI42_01166 [Thermosporothrix hazakensis]|jgi:hypothetical protein|uniref:Uncharacterized protein n=1 Tax=Thermosporothrix hazakensis TaxID=644383 RepID=A0A326UCJ7_THEHA|nr:hypothetical protein [Thermosporothrix hazakensis]PZW34329.1 hypothetical protein EI42_01166 [Thermosporothrix hazakensis]